MSSLFHPVLCIPLPVFFPAMLNVSVYPRGIIRGGEHSKSSQFSKLKWVLSNVELNQPRICSPFPQSHQMGDSSLSRALCRGFSMGTGAHKGVVSGITTVESLILCAGAVRKQGGLWTEACSNQWSFLSSRRLWKRETQKKNGVDGAGWRAGDVKISSWYVACFLCRRVRFWVSWNGM